MRAMKRIMAIILYAMVLMGASFANSWAFEIQDDSQALPAPPGAVEILFFSRCFWVFDGVLLTWGCDETLWGCSGKCSVGYPPGGNSLFLCIHALDSVCAGRKDTIVPDHSVFMGYPLSVTLCTEEPYHGQTKTRWRPTER